MPSEPAVRQRPSPLRLGLLLGANLLVALLIAKRQTFDSTQLLALLVGLLAVGGAVLLRWKWRAGGGWEARSFARRLLSVLAAIVLTLVMLEAAVRLIDPGRVSYLQEVGRYGQLLQPHPERNYEHRPHARGWLQGVEVRINAHGLRDVERSTTKPANTFRLLVLGDSVVFGWGVPFAKIYTRRLEALLNVKSTSRRFEVLNAGVCSYGSHQEWQFLRQHGSRYAPDAVLVHFVSNDANVRSAQQHDPLPTSDDDGTTPLLRMATRSRLVGIALHRLWTPTGREQQRVRMTAANPYWRTAREALLQMQDWSDARGIPLLIVNHNMFDAPWERQAGERLRELTRDRGLAVIDMAPWFAGRPAREYVNGAFDSHPNARGHELIARGLAAELTGRKIVPVR